MNLKLILAAGLLAISATAVAADSLRLTLPLPAESDPPINLNNIQYVDFSSYSDDNERTTAHSLEMGQEITPTYLDVYTAPGMWKQGWFMSAAAAASAFVGDPLGCDDLFGRLRPGFQFSLGKWFVPSAGIRLQYQGFQMKSGVLTDQQYHAVQTDFLFDVSSLWQKGVSDPRVALIPFAGCGIIINNDSRNHPFSLHYGLIGSLKLSSHIHLNLELSSMNTFKDFDGYGVSNAFGDQLLNASLGLSYTVGNKHAQKRVTDALPYMEQNRRLLSGMRELQTVNRNLTEELSQNEKVLREYEKILSIKGWLSNHPTRKGDEGKTFTSSYPYNNYSGLNSLRERLRNQQTKGKVGFQSSSDDFSSDDDVISALDNSLALPPDSMSMEDRDVDSCGFQKEENDSKNYLTLIRERKVVVGAPVLFFFELNSTHLTDESQLLNLEEIAKLAKTYHLKLKVIGAADSATGHADRNQKLSMERAGYISSELKKLGVPEEHILPIAVGGIDEYSPSVANRNTRVVLYL